MSKMIGRYITALLLAPVWVSTSAATYFSAAPGSGKFPADMTSENANGVMPLEHGYKHGYTTDGWTVEAIDASSYSFVSPSYSGTESPQDSWLTTPTFTVDNPNAWLRWDAKSVLPGFPEAYDVIVSESDDSETATIFHIDAEEPKWETRLVSLAPFAGKEVKVSFVCRSVDKYMLAVKNIFAGEFDKPEWIADNTTPRYASVSKGLSATGSVINAGAPADGIKIVCRIGEEEFSTEIAGIWDTSDSHDYSFELPLNLNEITSYIIGIQDAEGNFSPVVSSDVFSSHFVRNLVVDEGTGMWCNNCPEGILELEKLKREYADNIIELSCHANDIFALDDYWSHLKFYAVPYMMLNRNHDTAGANSKNFNKGYFSPTLAQIMLPPSVVADNNMVEVETETRFAENMDNSSDRYRIAYTVTADIYSPTNFDYYQQNNITFARGEQYYLLPSLIPCTLARFDNVVVDEDCAFTGIEGSLPLDIKAATDYSASLKITLPPIAEEAEKVRVVAYVLDTVTGDIMNATASIVTMANSVGTISADNLGRRFSIKVTPDGRCSVSGIADSEPLTITATDASGRIFDSFKATGQSLKEKVLNLPKGLAFVSVSARNGNAVTKIVRK